jgi:hypothetical protein
LLYSTHDGVACHPPSVGAKRRSHLWMAEPPVELTMNDQGLDRFPPRDGLDSLDQWQPQVNR